jgi:hypothetical protein
VKITEEQESGYSEEAGLSAFTLVQFDSIRVGMVLRLFPGMVVVSPVLTRRCRNLVGILMASNLGRGPVCLFVCLWILQLLDQDNKEMTLDRRSVTAFQSRHPTAFDRDNTQIKVIVVFDPACTAFRRLSLVLVRCVRKNG